MVMRRRMIIEVKAYCAMIVEAASVRICVRPGSDKHYWTGSGFCRCRARTRVRGVQKKVERTTQRRQRQQVARGCPSQPARGQRGACSAVQQTGSLHASSAGDNMYWKRPCVSVLPASRLHHSPAGQPAAHPPPSMPCPCYCYAIHPFNSVRQRGWHLQPQLAERWVAGRLALWAWRSRRALLASPSPASYYSV